MGEEASGSKAQSHPGQLCVDTAGVGGRSHVLPWEICPPAFWLTLLQRSVKGGQKSAEGTVDRRSDRTAQTSKLERSLSLDD